MIAEFLVIAAIPALLVAAAAWDLASYTIPNAISLTLLALFPILAVAVGMPLAQVGWHAAAGAIGLAAGFALFGFGFIGGGDAKLFAAVALILGPADMAAYALVASIFGGVLTLALLYGRSMPLPRMLARQSWLLRLHDPREGVPYGVALAAAAFFLLPSAQIFHLAASA